MWPCLQQLIGKMVGRPVRGLSDPVASGVAEYSDAGFAVLEVKLRAQCRNKPDPSITNYKVVIQIWSGLSGRLIATDLNSMPFCQYTVRIFLPRDSFVLP